MQRLKQAKKLDNIRIRKTLKLSSRNIVNVLGCLSSI